MQKVEQFHPSFQWFHTYDHTEHDVDVIVTEQGIADLRGLAPKERVPLIIENCAHPDFKDQFGIIITAQ